MLSSIVIQGSIGLQGEVGAKGEPGFRGPFGEKVRAKSLSIVIQSTK